MLKKLLKATAVLVALVSGGSLFGQAGDYAFSVSTSTYVPLGASATSVDILADTRSDTVAFGFDFYFEGQAYDSGAVASDGFLSFIVGASSTFSNDLDGGSGVRRPLVAPLWDDHDGNASSSASAYEVTGTAPNRVFTFEWRDWEWNYGSTDSVVSFQVKLYETTNVIEFHYRWECSSCVNNPSASIGLSGASTFLSVTDIDTGTPTVSNLTEDSSIDSVVTDQVLTFTPPACPSPSFLAFSNVKTDSITISWTSIGSGPWYVYWGPKGFDQASAGVSLDTVTATSFIAHGLMGSSAYSFYIKEDCGGGDTSAYAGPFTQSTVYVPPYMETFTNGYPGADYTEAAGRIGNPTVFTSTSSSAWKVDGFANVGTSGAASINIWSTTPKEWLIGPSIDLGTGATTYQVEMDVAVTDYNGPGTDAMGPDDSVVVVVSTDNGATWSRSNMVLALTAADNIPNGAGSHVSASLAGFTGTVKIGVYAQSTLSNTDFDFHIDNIEVRVPPACPDPTMLSSTLYGVDSVIVSWNSGAGAFNYNYGPTPTAAGAGTPIAVTDTFVVLTGLVSNTSYDFHVQASCSGGSSQSTYVSTAFTTPCLPLVAPLVETFDGATWLIGSSGGAGDAIDNCWNRNSNTGYKWSVFNGSTSSGNTGPDVDHTSGTGNFVYIESSSTSPSVAELVSPLIDVSALTTPYVAFWYHRYGSVATMGDMTVDVNGGNGWVTLLTITGTEQTSGTDAFLEKGVDVSSFGDTIQVRFVANSLGCCAGDMAIDDFEVREAPSCPGLVALNVSGVSDTSAILGWANSASANSYQVWYGPQGFYQGTMTTAGGQAFTTANSYTVDTLSASNCYEFLVRGICGPGDTTAWEGPVSFSTTAGALTLPILEDFENGLTVLRNNCNNVTDWLPQTAIVQNGTFAGKLTYQASDNSSLELAGTLDLTSVNNPTLSFWHIAKLEGGFDDAYVEISTDGGMTYSVLPAASYLGTAGSYATDLIFDEDDYTIWGTTTAPAQNTWWQKEVFSLAAYQMDSVMIRFRLTSDGSIQRDGWYMDDVIIEDVACQQPTTLGVVNSTVSFDTAQVYWTSGGASNFNIQFDTVGFALGTGMMVNSMNDSTVLYNLIPEACYDYYVRDSCGVGNVSGWSGPFSFCTTPTCPAPTGLGLSTNNLTINTADIYWTSGGGATDFNVEYGVSGFTRGMGTMMNLTNDTVSLSGLSPSVCYDFYVRDSCGLGDASVWVGPYTFCTPCVAYAAPYYESFSGNGWVADNTGSAPNSVIGVCWDRNPDNGTAYSWRVRSTTTASGSTGPDQDFSGTGNFVYTEASSGVTGDVAELISPQVNLSGTTAPILTFAYHFYGATINKMYVDINNGTSWILGVDSIIGQQQTSGVAPWMMDTIDLSTYSTSTIMVRFRSTSAGCCAGDMAIDEFFVGDPATCLRPTALGTSSPTATSVSANWTTGGASNWNIEYGPLGFTLGSGTHITNVSANPFTITGLTAGTCYEYYVRDSCGATSVSLWAGPYSFTTSSGALTFPVTEDFETGFTTFDNNCNNMTFWGIQQSIVNGGSNAAKLSYQDDDTSSLELKGPVDLTNTNAPVLMFAHIAALEGGFDEGHVQISIDGGATYTDLPDSAYLGTAAGYALNKYFEEDDYAIWGTTLAPAQNTWWQQEMFDLSAYKTTNVRVRFQTDTDGSIQRDGWYIDDIQIVEMPCVSATNVAVAVQGCDTVDISWTSTSATTVSYIEYGTKGFTAGSGTVVPNVASPYQLTGLTLNTEYDVYVVDSCAMDASNPSTVVTFKTDSVGPVLASFTSVQTSTTMADAMVDVDGSTSTGDGLTYDWDFGNSTTGSGVNAQGTYTTNGTYSVVLTVTDRCGNTDDTTIVVTVAGISIVENEYNAGIEMYPNPNNGTFNVNVTNGAGTYSIEVLDLSGRVVYQERNITPGTAHKVELRNKAKGVYMVRLKGDGLNVTQRMVID